MYTWQMSTTDVTSLRNFLKTAPCLSESIRGEFAMGVPLLTQFALLVNACFGAVPAAVGILGLSDPRLAWAVPFFKALASSQDGIDDRLVAAYCAGFLGVTVACLAGLAAIITGSRIPTVAAPPLVGAFAFHAWVRAQNPRVLTSLSPLSHTLFFRCCSSCTRPVLSRTTRSMGRRS
jgi:hypothetical protein